MLAKNENVKGTKKATKTDMQAGDHNFDNIAKDMAKYSLVNK